MVSDRIPSKTPTTGAASPWSAAADRVAIVVNGKAKGVTEDLIDMLDQIVRSGDLFVSRNLAEGRDIARTIVERGYPTVLTGGGDGTFVQMVSWIVRMSEKADRDPPRFGLLRLGTGNALAWVLGAQNKRGRGVMADLGRLRMEGGSRSMRLIQVEDLLTPFAGLGADAVALNHYHQTKQFLQDTWALRPLAASPSAYAIAILGRSVPHFSFARPMKVQVVNRGNPAVQLGQNGRPVGTPIGRGDVLYEGTARLVAMSTIPYWGFGARVFPYAEERADKFSLRVADLKPPAVLRGIRAIWKGTFQHSRLRDFLVDEISVRCEEPTPLQVGGDVLGRRTAIRAGLSERPIRVVDYYAPPPIDISQ